MCDARLFVSLGTGADPGFPLWGHGPIFWEGMDLRYRHFSVKMCVKMKELGPVGGGRVPENFVCISTNA